MTALSVANAQAPSIVIRVECSGLNLESHDALIDPAQSLMVLSDFRPLSVISVEIDRTRSSRESLGMKKAIEHDDWKEFDDR
jgi:hypothetical protein